MFSSARGQGQYTWEAEEESRWKCELGSLWGTLRVFTMSIEALVHWTWPVHCHVTEPGRVGSTGQGLRGTQSPDREREPGPRGRNIPRASSVS